jgi:hypothetical protein
MGVGLAYGYFSQSSESPLDHVQRILDDDAAKGRFTGTLGNFVVYSRTGASLPDVVDCPLKDRESTSDKELLERSELWQDVFSGAPNGLVCDGKVIVINSGSDPLPDGTQSIVKMYFRAFPVPVAFDAPRDRIALTKINEHEAIVEKPLEGYPFATTSLAVVQRPPSEGVPGIVVYVNFAPGLEGATDLAKRLTQ